LVDTNNTKDTKDTFGVHITASDYGRKKETIHKTKLATEDKTTYKWCRNCNCKNKNKELYCTQCGRSTFSKRKLR
jgi:Zn finger protein HypA/HybF involved in hydrogenase expression